MFPVLFGQTKKPATAASALTSIAGYWKLDEASGNRADSLGVSALAPTATPGNATGIISNAVALNGSSQYLSCASNANLQAGDVDLMCWGWVFLTTKASITRTIMGKLADLAVASTMEYWLGYVQSTDRFSFFVSDNTNRPNVNANTFGSPSINTWYLVIGWRNKAAQTINISINGGTTDSASFTAALNSTSSSFYIGHDGNSRLLAGRIDEAGIAKAVPTAADIARLYNGGSGSTYPFDLSAPTFLGAWTWFNDARAVSYNGVLYVGWVSRTGDIYIESVSGATYRRFALHGTLQQDDHNNPSILVLNDGKLLTAYCQHNGPMYVRKSTSAEDIRAWGSETDISSAIGGSVMSYASLVQLTGESNNVYLFYRHTISGNDRPITYAKSTDNGASWATQVQVLRNTSQRPYFKVARNGTTRIDFACNDGHPSEVSTNSLYHFYYSGGNYYKSDGTQIVAALPFAPTDVTKVYDGTTNRSWMWDIQISGGNPVIVYAVFNSTTDHRYRYARWTGSAWDDHQICTAGQYIYSDEPYYSGGICIDPADATTIYCSRESGGIFNVWKGVTADGGTTWTMTQVSASVSSTDKVIRPYVVAGTLMWVRGDYRSYTDYETAIQGV